VEKHFPQEGIIMSDDTTTPSTTDLVKQLQQNIQAKLDNGETAGIAEEIKALEDLKIGLPIRDGEPIRVKRTYTVTEAVRAANRANAQHSTGPKTPEGKATCSKNGWKHGKYAQSRILGLGKPCKSTCPQYPCSIVEEGGTQPGGDCLNREHLVEACQAIERALKTADFESLNDLMTVELGETLAIIRELRASILEHGPVVESAKVDKDGRVIGYELKPHPSLLALPNLMKNLGISFTDYNLTPAALAKVKTDEKAADSIADIFRAAGNALAHAKKIKAGE
jgi:hypothetical protein